MHASGTSLPDSSGRSLHFETKSNWNLFGIQLPYQHNKLLGSLISIDMILFHLAGHCKNSTAQLNDASLCCLCHSVQERKKKKMVSIHFYMEFLMSVFLNFLQPIQLKQSWTCFQAIRHSHLISWSPSCTADVWYLLGFHPPKGGGHDINHSYEL